MPTPHLGWALLLLLVAAVIVFRKRPVIIGIFAALLVPMLVATLGLSSLWFWAAWEGALAATALLWFRRDRAARSETSRRTMR